MIQLFPICISVPFFFPPLGILSFHNLPSQLPRMPQSVPRYDWLIIVTLAIWRPRTPLLSNSNFRRSSVDQT